LSHWVLTMAELDLSGRADRRLNLGVVLPVLLVAFVVADVACRALPPARFSFRAWEAMSRFPANGGPFQPNTRYADTHTYGDLTALGNLRRQRRYRPEVFTTDAFGFRNPPHSDSGTASAILVGSSMSVGSGVNDDQTLAAQLSALDGARVYNAAGVLWRLQLVSDIAARLHLQHGTVIYEYLERIEPFPVDALREPVACTASKSLRASDWRCGIATRMKGVQKFSPVKIWSEQGYRWLLNDTILPNRLKDSIARRRLVNGDEMYFLKGDTERLAERRSPDDGAAHLIDLSHALAERGLQLVVFLLPEKYSVYASHVQVPQSGASSGSTILAAVEQRLRASGVPVVNLTPTFIALATQLLGQHRYVYWPDDSHWNACGIAVAAREIWRVWRHAEPPESEGLPAACLADVAVAGGG
jgi:acetyltransferase AlgX (SGNH hydrolase-like protein)